jgi:hypothetical protein
MLRSRIFCLPNESVSFRKDEKTLSIFSRLELVKGEKIRKVYRICKIRVLVGGLEQAESSE